jgi:ribosome recycling factor
VDAADEGGDLRTHLRKMAEDAKIDVRNTRRALMQEIGRSADRNRDMSEGGGFTCLFIT